MKMPPLINIDKFKKRYWLDILSPNREMFWYALDSTYHHQTKNDQREGIEIKWEGNPFELNDNYDYILEK